MSIPTRAELDGMIRERLASDPEFRAALIADPRAAVSALVGIDLPDVVTVTVHEESLTDLHLVLPAVPSGAELSDRDLELVSGGAACWSDSCTSGP